nr:ribosomal protein L32 [Ulva tepida]UXW92174.1 ribosomal protein L32 [Ulva tepida]
MAVPKKRTSKSKKNKRKTSWKNKAVKQIVKAINLANTK